jgi:hypothetical protein
MGVEGRRQIADRRRDLPSVEAESDDQRVEVADEGFGGAQDQRDVVAEELAQRREAGRRLFLHRGQRFEARRRFRRQLAEGDQGRREFFRHWDQLFGERVGVYGEVARRLTVNRDSSWKARNSASVSWSRWAEAQLLGRVTYEGFAAAWPSMEDDQGFAEKLTDARTVGVGIQLVAYARG